MRNFLSLKKLGFLIVAMLYFVEGLHQKNKFCKIPIVIHAEIKDDFKDWIFVEFSVHLLRCRVEQWSFGAKKVEDIYLFLKIAFLWIM